MIWDWFETGGQVVIYDANNGTREQRQALAEKFDKEGIHVIMLGEFPSILSPSHNWTRVAETICDNKEIIERNIRSVKISSPDV
jgi:6-phosphofructo-2-kinase/fructose-2,6-biphosphatase 4